MNDTIDYQIVTENIASTLEPKLRFLDGTPPMWNFIVVFLAIVMMVLNKQLFKKRFHTLLTLFFQPSDEQKMTRDSSSVTDINGLSVTIVYIGLLAFIVQKTVLLFGGSSILYSGFDFYVDLCVFISAYLIVQYLAVSFFGWLLNFPIAANRHLASHLSTSIALVIVMVVISLIIIFYPNKIFLVVAIAVILVMTGFRLIKTFFEMQILTKMNLIQIFLYLCTLEIVPISVAVTMMLRLIASDCVL